MRLQGAPETASGGRAGREAWDRSSPGPSEGVGPASRPGGELLLFQAPSLWPLVLSPGTLPCGLRQLLASDLPLPHLPNPQSGPSALVALQAWSGVLLAEVPQCGTSLTPICFWLPS